MSYKIKFHKQVIKFLEKCDINIAERFYENILILEKEPYKNNLDIKALKWEEKGNYRMRIWKYRFKYMIIDEEIIIYFYDAWNRGNIYK